MRTKSGERESSKKRKARVFRKRMGKENGNNMGSLIRSKRQFTQPIQCVCIKRKEAGSQALVHLIKTLKHNRTIIVLISQANIIVHNLILEYS